MTKRLSQGFTSQTTYTWSRSLASNATGSLGNLAPLPDPRDRRLHGKTLTAQHRTHQIRSNGTFELPLGPNKLLLANSAGWVSRLVERWQLGIIFNLESGAPFTVTGPASPFRNGGTNYPNMVAEIPKNFGSVKITNIPGVITYFEGLQQVNDPGRANLTTLQGLQGQSTLRAIADSQGRLLLVNPPVGTLGNMGPNWLEGPGTIGLDANLVKRVRISESKDVEFRLDAINVLNHPTFGLPNANISNTNFGRIPLPDAGYRQFTFNARFNF